MDKKYDVNHDYTTGETTVKETSPFSNSNIRLAEQGAAPRYLCTPMYDMDRGCLAIVSIVPTFIGKFYVIGSFEKVFSKNGEYYISLETNDISSERETNIKLEEFLEFNKMPIDQAIIHNNNLLKGLRRRNK